jgi:hypothetical protein
VNIPDKETPKHYPITTAYVNTILPVIPLVFPKVYAAFEKYCGDSNLARQAISSGKNPRFFVAYTEVLMPDKSVVNGFFWATYHTQRIVIDVRNVRKFEKDPLKYTKAMEYLLLHESIHWARYHAGLNADVPPNAGLRPGEAGDEFEAEAYGKDVSYLWDL